MLLLLMAATSGMMSSAELLNGTEVVTLDDTPQQILQNDRNVFEDVRVVVTPTGRPERCDLIGEVQGGKDNVQNRVVRQLSCTLMIRRAKFRPATSIDGQPAYGTFSAWVAWRSGDAPFYRGPDHVDADVSVAALPSGIIDPALIDVNVAIAEDGTPSACSAAFKEKYASPLQVISPVLAKIACAQLTSKGKLNPAHKQSGEAVASVQRLVVRFSTTSTADVTSTGSK